MHTEKAGEGGRKRKKQRKRTTEIKKVKDI
jgi:hypothetical protein